MSMKNYFLKVLIVVATSVAPLAAQEVATIKPGDLKESPQRYWASFFVFADTFTESPGNRSTEVDDEEVYRFKTEIVGEVYAEPAAADKLRELEPGGEYLFFATVKQEKSGLFGRLRGGEFVVIVKEVSVVERDAEAIAGLMAGAQDADATNRAAVALRTLNEVSQAVQQELFGFARSEGITVEELLADPEYQQKVAGSIRSSLRRYEQQNRSSSQELFVDVIRSLLVSGGASKPAPVEVDIYVPDDIEITAPDAPAQGGDEALLEALAIAQTSLQLEIDARTAAEDRITELEASLAQITAESAVEGEEVQAVTDDALALELSATREELEREVEARTSAESRVAELQARIEVVMAKLLAIEEGGEGDIPEQAGLMVSYELTEAKLEQETADRKKAQKRVEELQARVNELTGQVEALSADAAAMDSDVEERVAQAWASARADLERESSARAKAEARVEELLARLDELNVAATAELSDELERELTLTRAELSEIQMQYGSARDEVARLTAEMESLKEQTEKDEELSATLEDARSRLASEAEARSIAERRVNDLGVEVERLQVALTGLEKDLRDARRPAVPALRMDSPRSFKAAD